MNETKKTLTVTPRWAITIVCGAILSGIVTGTFGALNVLNGDHFALVAVSEKVTKLEQTTVDKELYNTRYDNLCEKIDGLNKKVDNLTNAVNGLYNR